MTITMKDLTLYRYLCTVYDQAGIAIPSLTGFVLTSEDFDERVTKFRYSTSIVKKQSEVKCRRIWLTLSAGSPMRRKRDIPTPIGGIAYAEVDGRPIRVRVLRESLINGDIPRETAN